MTYFPIPVEQFGGLNLTDDPGEVGFSGAVDLLNVDFDQHGRVQSRDGFVKLNAVAATGALAGGIGVLPGADAAHTYIVSGRTAGDLVAYDATGTVVASGVGSGDSPIQFVAIGTGAAGPYLYIAWTGGTIRRFDGAAFSSPAGMPNARSLALSSTSNRLVATDVAVNLSRVKFSDPGAPETWGANNFVDLHPNDGQKVRALIGWRDLVFAFKDYKFFTFYGESTDSSGNPIFNYRTVDASQGVTPFSGTQIPVCAAPDAVYFANTAGIWRTTGGLPEKISAPLDPLFREEASPFFTAFSAFPSVTTLVHLNGRLFAPMAAGKVLVYTIATGTWSVWSTNINALTTMKIGNAEQLVFTNSSTRFYYYSAAATTDDGSAITSYYQSGFENLAPPRRYIDKYGFGPSRKRVRSWRVAGSGTVTMAVAADEGATKGATSLTLGTSPAIAEARYSWAIRGAKISYRLSATAAWSVNNLVAMLADTRESGSDVSDS